MTWKRPLLNGIVQDESENLDDLVNEVFEEFYGKPTINRENEKDKKHSCLKCRQKFENKIDLMSHLKTDHEEKNFKCSECDQLFPEKNAMLRHYRFVHEGRNDRFHCHLCEYQARSFQALKIHIDSIHESLNCQGKRYNYQPTQKSNSQTQIQMKHEGFKFSINKTYKSLVYVSKPKSQKAIKSKLNCDICDYSGRTKAYLKIHIDAVHKKIKHPCSQCEKLFAQKSSLNLHTKIVHDGIKVSCNFCEKKATTKQHIRDHMLKHHRAEYEKI